MIVRSYRGFNEGMPADPVSAVATGVGLVAQTVGSIFDTLSGAADRRQATQITLATDTLAAQQDRDRAALLIAQTQAAGQANMSRMLMYGGLGLGALIVVGLILKR